MKAQTTNLAQDFLKEKINKTPASDLYQGGITSNKTGGYTVINKYLREDKVYKGANEKLIKETIEDLDKEFTKKLTKDVQLYRGIGDFNEIINKDLQVGDIFSDKAYTSTTTDKNVIKRFITKMNPKDEPVVLKINTKKGQKYIKPKDQYEKEILLQRGLEFKVTRKTKFIGEDGDKTMMYDVDIIDE